MSNDFKPFRLFLVFAFALMGYMVGAVICGVLGLDTGGYTQGVSTACSVTAALLVFEGTKK